MELAAKYSFTRFPRFAPPWRLRRRLQPGTPNDTRLLMTHNMTAVRVCCRRLAYARPTSREAGTRAERFFRTSSVTAFPLVESARPLHAV
jgi:hypothetical protein